MQRKFPKYVNKILKALTNEGFEAYVVGGAVRDLLLGIEPGDFDITTNGKPEDVSAICIDNGWAIVDNLGNNFGCTVAVVDGAAVEITTFRGEEYGSDAHKPERIWYCDTLKEDMSRRDFSVNAMALDKDGKLYDYFGGERDLEAKVLRTVGNSITRYREDALRMYRACRFVGQLGFAYADEQNAEGSFGDVRSPYFLEKSWSFPVEAANNLSLERVRKELDKLFTSEYAGQGLMLYMATGLNNTFCRVKENGEYLSLPVLPELNHLVGLHQNPRFHCYDVWEHTLTAIDNSPRDLAIRWALLLHDVGKGLPNIRCLNDEGQPSDRGHEKESAVIAQEILTRLRYPKKFVKRVVWLVARHMRFAPMLWTKERTLLRWLRSETAEGFFRDSAELVDAFEQLKEVFLADMGATHAGKNEQLMSEGEMLADTLIKMAATEMPVHTGDLNISGKDIEKIAAPKEIGQILKHLLLQVRSGNVKNTHDELMESAVRWVKRNAKE